MSLKNYASFLYQLSDLPIYQFLWYQLYYLKNMKEVFFHFSVLKKSEEDLVLAQNTTNIGITFVTCLIWKN